jgi:hypothetical protein
MSEEQKEKVLARGEQAEQAMSDQGQLDQSATIAL